LSFPCQMMPFWILLFAEDRFNRGKSSRSRPLYPRCGHDLSPPRCPSFLEAGTPDLLWLYKNKRKASEKGGNGDEGAGGKNTGNKKKSRAKEKKQSKKRVVSTRQLHHRLHPASRQASTASPLRTIKNKQKKKRTKTLENYTRQDENKGNSK